MVIDKDYIENNKSQEHLFEDDCNLRIVNGKAVFKQNIKEQYKTPGYLIQHKETLRYYAAECERLASRDISDATIIEDIVVARMLADKLGCHVINNQTGEIVECTMGCDR